MNNEIKNEIMQGLSKLGYDTDYCVMEEDKSGNVSLAVDCWSIHNSNLYLYFDGKTIWDLYYDAYNQFKDYDVEKEVHNLVYDHELPDDEKWHKKWVVDRMDIRYQIGDIYDMFWDIAVEEKENEKEKENGKN